MVYERCKSPEEEEIMVKEKEVRGLLAASMGLEKKA